MQVRLQVFKVKLAAERRAVVQQMQVTVGEIDDARAIWPFDPRFARVPFIGHHPVEYLASRRYLVNLKRQIAAQNIQRLAHAFAGNAAAKRIEMPHERMHPWPRLRQRVCAIGRGDCRLGLGFGLGRCCYGRVHG